MKICLASIHPRMLSGQIESLIALRDGLDSLGHEVEVVSAFRPDELKQSRRWETDLGGGVALAPKVVRIGHIVREIVRVARECDLLQLNLPTPAFGMLADAIQLATRRPTVVGFEAHLADVPAVTRRLASAPEFYGPRIVVNNGAVARLTVRRATRYVVASEYQRAELRALGYDRRRVQVIPNLIDEAKLQRWDREEARRALQLPDGELVAFVGHYHDVKGHDVLVEAFRAVLAHRPNAWLVLAWSGIGHRGRLQAAVQRAGVGERVIELGRIDVSQLFSAADVVTLPYRFSIGQAAFPGTVIEAMWVGAPLVTSDLPLLAELAEGGEAALLARPGDPAHLAEHIVHVLEEPALAHRLVERQRDMMERRFDRRKLLEAYVRVYGEALARKASVLQPAGHQ